MEPMATTQPLIRIRGSATVTDAARLMSDMSIGALGVDDDHHNFVGLFTERDLMWVVAQGKDPHETLVGDVMNDFPLIVQGRLTQRQAAARMLGAHIRHVIIQDGGKLLVTSARDLIPEVAGPTAVAHLASVAELRHMFGDGILSHPSISHTGVRAEPQRD